VRDARADEGGGADVLAVEELPFDRRDLSRWNMGELSPRASAHWEMEHE